MSHSFLSYYPNNKNEIITATASGRLDIMGGVGDYSGSLVLQKAIGLQAKVSLAKNEVRKIRIFTADKTMVPDFFELDLETCPELSQIDLGIWSNYLHYLPGGHWVSYLIGPWLCLIADQRLNKLTGLDLLIESNVPVGKGVSSSASIEIATLRALVKLYRIELDPIEMAILAQRAENRVAGAPCGIMDQMTSSLGHVDFLLPLICQPHQVLPLIKIPDEVYFIGLDSGQSHKVSGSNYKKARTATFMAFSMICQKYIQNNPAASGLPFGGYLANIKQEDYHHYGLPESMLGADFLEQYSHILDTLSEVDPLAHYSVKASGYHPVGENQRIHLFAELIQSRPFEIESLKKLGDIMLESHKSYSAIGLGNEYTDIIADRVYNGHFSHLYGARISGGGNGGTVILLAHSAQGRLEAQSLKNEMEILFNKKLLLIE